MADIFGDNPPQDMARGKKGWLKPRNTGSRKYINALRQENIDLKSRLDALEELVTGITAKKSKKVDG